MKYKSVLFLGLLILFIFVLNACMNKQIKLLRLESPKDLKSGDSGLIIWEFQNAEIVRLQGITKAFEPIDSVYVAPRETTEYSIIGYQGNVDSLEKRCSVEVKQVKGSKGITRGDFKLGNYKLEPSIFNSDYLSGSEEYQKAQGINTLRILQLQLNNSTRVAIIKAIILDKFGNLIKNIDDKKSKWGIKTSFGAISHYFDVTAKFDPSKNINTALFSILIDESSSTDKSYIIENIKNFILKISPNDSLMIGTFSEVINTSIPPIDAGSALGILDKISFKESDGLSSLYLSTFKILNEMKSVPNRNKYLIIITSNNNNTFSPISSKEISDYAKSLGVPIYIIGTGLSFDPYPMRYLCHSTGGTYYSVDLESESYKVDKMLFEIAYSNVIPYYFDFSVPLPTENCKSLLTQMYFTQGEKSVSDNINIIFKYDEPYQKNRIVALFDHHSGEIEERYISLLKELATYLIINPEKKIELIGTRSMEEEILAEADISLKRAENTKRLLLDFGVPDQQIKVIGKGSTMPFYYFEQEEWQKLYNRRVELRWLSPEYLPYEILAESCISEDEAQKKVEIWEQRGFKSYFDRYISSGNPIYQVKIWGFAEESEAKRIAVELSRNYGHNYKVE